VPRLPAPRTTMETGAMKVIFPVDGAWYRGRGRGNNPVRYL
jgi:hypothetical protein